MFEYKYIIEQEKRKIVNIEGKTLKDFFVDIVEPEFNIAYLIFTDSVYSVKGTMGSEVISINQINYSDIDFVNRQIIRFIPFSIFCNKKIIQVRSIGEEFNGHGFEISFEGVLDKGMIIQSIYTGDKPIDFNDCIRLGISQYYYSSDYK
jgi:hypothetical protein